MIRNHQGFVIAFLSQKISPSLWPLEVEDLAAAWALEFAAELGITDAVLEGDSLMLIQALKKKILKKKISRPYLQNEIIIPKLKNTLYQLYWQISKEEGAISED